MLSTFMTALATNAALGWLMRRLGEVFGIFAFITSIILALPPGYQDVIILLLTGRGGELTVSAVFGLAVWAFTQWRSYRATVKPQVVDTKGKRVEVPTLTDAEALAMNNAVTGHNQTHIPTR